MRTVDAGCIAWASQRGTRSVCVDNSSQLCFGWHVYLTTVLCIGEWQMLRTSTLMIVAATLLVFGLGNAFAQMMPKMQMSGKSGACPAGTCAMNGGNMAKTSNTAGLPTAKKPSSKAAHA
jgi:hypothetical protein